MPARNTMLGVVGCPVRGGPDHDTRANDAERHEPKELSAVAPAVPLEVNRHA